MKNIFLAIPGLALVSLLTAGAPVAAQTANEKVEVRDAVTVYAPFVVRLTPHKATGGVNRQPLSLVTVNRSVSFRDLDLKNPIDQQTLKTRVNQAAKDACGEIERRYPKNRYIPVPVNQDCVKNAVNESMVVVRELILAANTH